MKGINPHSIKSNKIFMIYRILLNDTSNIRTSMREKKWSKVARRVCGGLTLFFYFFKRISVIVRIMFGTGLIIDQFEVPITTQCTLKCKACSNLMPYYEHPYQIGHEKIIEYVDRLLGYIDWVDKVLLLGGEPFLHQNISDIINYLCEQKKVGKVLIITNATIMPSDIVFETLKNKKVYVEISDYGKHSKNKEKMLHALKEKQINYSCREFQKDVKWTDWGEPISHGRSVEELTKQYQNCGLRCKSYLNGKLYHCPRAAHGMDLGVIPDNKNDYLDIMNDAKEMKTRLFDFYNLGPQYIIACDYCNLGTPLAVEIEAGVQVNE